jgi:hypothetical protein
MNPEQRLQLNELVRANNSVDNTALIRKLKHSDKILADVQKMVAIKGNRGKEAESECSEACPFLYTHYTALFNRLLRDRLDLSILTTFLAVLKEIEEGIVDQHDAAFKIGTLLKELYIDPRLEEIKENHIKGQPITWQEYKKMNTT